MKKVIASLFLVLVVCAIGIANNLQQSAVGLVQQGNNDGTSRPALPADEEIRTLASTSVLGLAEAVHRNDFSDFLKSMAKIAQSQMDPDQLRTAFKPLIEQKADLTSVRGVNPVFTAKPAVNSEGKLELKGYYPAKPNQIGFTLNYTREDGRWKLFGIYVTPEGVLLTSEKAEIPRQSELIAITNSNMLVFAIAIHDDDFSGFYRSLSQLWQGQTSKDRLRTQLSTFLQKKISLEVIAGIDPVFDQEPSLDGNGVLTLAGHYPTDSYRVDFRLKFVSEKSIWKLAGINVSTINP